MECFDLELPYNENQEMIKRCKYTRYPVCRGDKDTIEGFIHIKDLYWSDEQISGTDYDNLPVREIIAVSESLSVDRQVQIMQEKETKFGLVVDEYGGTAGIVTSSDIMAQIVGNIDDDEYIQSDDSEVVTLGYDRFLIDGSLPVSDVVELIGFEPDKTDECETAAGLLLGIFDRMPEVGERITIEHNNTNVTFVVVNMDKHRIDKIGIKIKRKQPEEQHEAIRWIGKNGIGDNDNIEK